MAMDQMKIYNPDFFKQFGEYLTGFQSDNVIIGVNFNSVVDVNLDKQGGNAMTHDKSQSELQKVKHNLNLGGI